MRERLTEDRLRMFMRMLGRRARVEGRVYVTGGATAVLYRYPAIDAARFRNAVEATLRLQ
ncbi:MAG TPA: hypothetical protein VEK11_04345 [Thermoanaerobaculia bacterium]|jgi:hypothetical protein|nr:hypothetical protein [Thermoanaerobaculia bacterium]